MARTQATAWGQRNPKAAARREEPPPEEEEQPPLEAEAEVEEQSEESEEEEESVAPVGKESEPEQGPAPAPPVAAAGAAAPRGQDDGGDESSRTSNGWDEEIELDFDPTLPHERQMRKVDRRLKRWQRKTEAAEAAAEAANKAAAAAKAEAAAAATRLWAANRANVVEFALSPGLHVTGVWNFGNTDIQKLYHKAIKTVMPPDGFDCSAQRLTTFLKGAEQYGWDQNILMIPFSATRPDGERLSLITQHGELSLRQVRAGERLHVFSPRRHAQDSNMLYECLMNSLTEQAKDCVHLCSEEYTITSGDGRREFKSGPALLKVIIKESHLDTNATATAIRAQLASLHEYIRTIDCDIVQFNEHVKRLVEGLASRGQESTDLLTFLFKAYAAVDDTTFVTYMGRQKERYEDGGDLEPNKLMQLAANKFKNLQLEGTWKSHLGKSRTFKP